MRLTVRDLKKIVRESILEAEGESSENPPNSSSSSITQRSTTTSDDASNDDIKVLGDSRGDAIEVIIAILERAGAPTDYSIKSSDDPPSHHRSIATMLVDKVRKYSGRSVYRLRFKISKHSIKALDDNRTIAAINLDDFERYVRGAIKHSSPNDPWGELVMDYDWSRRST